jgi:hypothetical protein
VSEGTFGFGGGDPFELTRLNRALDQLARPALSEDWHAPMTRSQLIDLGVFATGRGHRREEVIERLWSRKRRILRQVSAFARDPQPPVA